MPPRVKEEVISSDCPPDSQTPRGRLSGGYYPPLPRPFAERPGIGSTDSSACGLRMTGLNGGAVGDPARAQRSGSRGERRGSGVSELSCTHGSEGYAACPDDVSRETSSEESTLHSVRQNLPDIHSVSFFLLPPQGPLRLCPCGDPENHRKKNDIIPPRQKRG